MRPLRNCWCRYHLLQATEILQQSSFLIRITLFVCLLENRTEYNVFETESVPLLLWQGRLNSVDVHRPFHLITETDPAFKT